MAGNLGNTVGDVIHHIDARNVLLLEEVDRLAFLFGKNCDQNIGTCDFALA